MKIATLLPLLFIALCTRGAEQAELKDLSVNGGITDGKARITIEGFLGTPHTDAKTLFSTAVEHRLWITRDKHSHTIDAKFEILQGEPKEFVVPISGEAEVKKVTGDELLDWSVRQETNGVRSLVLRLRGKEKVWNVQIIAERELRSWSDPIQTFAIGAAQPALFHGYLKVEVAPELEAQATNTVGLAPIETALLPDSMRETVAEEPRPLAFRFQGTAYSLPLIVRIADPEARRVVLRDFQLRGKLAAEGADFVLTATAQVKNPRGGALNILGGAAALSDLEKTTEGRMRFVNGQYVLYFDKPGEFPLHLKFRATVHEERGWRMVDFHVAPAALAPVIFEGLAVDTQFRFTNGARPQRSGEVFQSFLPGNGNVNLSWKESPAAVEGKLFYSAEMLSQIAVSPGLMQQVAILDGKVMQGELSRLVLTVRGAGNVTAIQGASVLAWNFEEKTSPTERRIVVQFNQPQKESFSLRVQMQMELSAFPQAFDAMKIQPEGATRFAGNLRVVNEGAVRLEVLQSTGLSQISPEQFPETEATKALFLAAGTQRFAFRFSTSDFQLRIQADNISPEVSVSELLAYHLGERELAIDAEFELDIREAPVREVSLGTPRGYAVARINVPGMNDYFFREPEGETNAELRIVYGQPVSGRQVIQLRLERNSALGAAVWDLPRVEVSRVKSTRGHVAVSSDPGFRLTPERTSGLTDIARAFFPRKVAGIHAAFRISESAWDAAMRVERLPQSITADVLHLFSIGEGIAYGSSTMNFFISGAPVSSLLVQLSDEYFNVEFTGKDVRNNWQKTTNGFIVSLNTPVSGAYTLLCTYERPFKGHGDTLTFTGARPMDAQTEQGHTLVVSAYQFQVKPVNLSPGLTALETAEVPAEYRLFFDAPILAAYRYTSRPFDLQLALSPLAQAETLGLVVDRVALTTRISKDGEVVTDAQYFVKNRGHPYFRFSLPADTTLWSVTVNGTTAVPVKDGEVNLIPLSQRADPNSVQTLAVKFASRSKTPTRVLAAAPIVAAPVLLAEWNVHPDTGQRLVFQKGSLMPGRDTADGTGFAAIIRLVKDFETLMQWVAAIGLMVFAVCVCRWAARVPTRVRKVGGGIIALAATLLSATLLLSLASWLSRGDFTPERGLTFLAPVMQSGGALSIEVSNVALDQTAWSLILGAWPVVLALLIWIYTWTRDDRFMRTVGRALGWTSLAWAALRMPNGGGAFITVCIAFFVVQVLIPAIRSIAVTPTRSITAALLLTLLPSAIAQNQPVLAESVAQQIRIEDEFVQATAEIRWTATNNQALPILFEPAVLTRLTYPTNALKLIQAQIGPRPAHQLVALQSGSFTIQLEYQMQVTQREGESGFALPTHPGLVNRVTLTLPEADVDVASTNSVSTQHQDSTNSTIVTLLLAPVMDSWIVWKPRSRDVRREKPQFYAELTQLYVPTAGVIEGLHQIMIRPAQGEIGELLFDVPGAATITDATGVALWRFDPDSRKLRVTISPAQSKPFTITIRSQVSTGTLPAEKSVGLLRIHGAAGQLGAVGLATGNEVQLDSVAAPGLAPINLEDFPAAALEPLRGQISGLTLRRAFRYTDAASLITLKASTVEPDIRVETQETFSVGEDRTVLAVNATVEITRAGIFRLSFVLPTRLDVESISGAGLSHWTELKSDAGRIITMHLQGRTEGQRQFNISLSGPGVRAMTNFVAPRFLVREASKQRGQLVIVPEQGMRLQVGTRDGVTQLDPQKAGIRQKGVLAFRLLQMNWSLALEIETVEAWVQVTSLQHLNVSEAQLKGIANLQYQIENTGLKSLRVLLPADADGVRFRGDQVADFLALTNQTTNGMRAWEVKLHRRVIGKYFLQAHWQAPLADSATNTLVRGVQAADANLQSGFVTIRSSGRLQLRISNPPETLQPAEWQSIPRTLRQDVEDTSANYTFRLVEPAFVLALGLERHEATRLLPARVNHVTLTSVISDEGVMLTQARLDLIPGDKRLLHLSLPQDASFWFAFVNQNGVWPWREQDRILLPLEQQSAPDKPTSVEFFYSTRVASPARQKLDVTLFGPKFDLPLEDITWRVFVNQKWHISDTAGTLHLQAEVSVPSSAVTDLQSYLSNEMNLNREKTKAAEEMLGAGNLLLQKGDQQQARRAFQSAYGLSQHDGAFNEDARVQLHNLKLEQAIVGLNVRQFSGAGEAAANLQQLRNRKDANYTQQDARQIMDSNSADDNAALTRLAERLVQQQDAALLAPTTIRVAIPEQGRMLTFRRAVLVGTWADMNVRIEAKSDWTNSGSRLATLGGVFVGFLLFATLARSFQPRIRPTG